MTARQLDLWIAAGGLFLTIVGATWWLGTNLATKTDISDIRLELLQDRQRSESQMEELRGYIVSHFDGHPGGD